MRARVHACTRACAACHHACMHVVAHACARARCRAQPVESWNAPGARLSSISSIFIFFASDLRRSTRIVHAEFPFKRLRILSNFNFSHFFDFSSFFGPKKWSKIVKICFFAKKSIFGDLGKVKSRQIHPCGPRGAARNSKNYCLGLRSSAGRWFQRKF